MNVLGLDISTSRIGLCVINEKEEILVSEVLKLDSKHSLEFRASIFADWLSVLPHPVDKVFIEQPIQFMTNQSAAHTLMVLHTFSGMARYVVSQQFDEPVLLNVNSMRSKLGIKIPRGVDKKIKKKVIIDWVQNKYKNSATPFDYKTTPQGNPVPGTDDRADAVIVALTGLKE